MTWNHTETGSHLTTSRINRILRPLRNKCLVLASNTPTSVASTSKSTWSPDDRPPLALLLPSSRIGTKLRLDKSSASLDEFELARKIYAVCDSFRNVVQVAFGPPCHNRIPTLAALCSVVIGQNIPLDGDNLCDETGEAAQAGDESLMKFVDDMYEAVPAHTRRWTVVSHALSIILSTCSAHHTLLSSLLDICLSHGLQFEANLLLRSVIEAAFSSSQPNVIPITHPAHISYLADIHAKWIGASQTSTAPQQSNPFTTSVFSHILLEVLSNSNSLTIWESKALHAFVGELHVCDQNSFVSIVDGLAEAIAIVERRQSKGKGRISETYDVTNSKQRLSEWLGKLLDQLMSGNDVTSSKSQILCRDIDSITLLLDRCHAAGWQITNPNEASDLSDVIMAIATYIFAGPYGPSTQTPCLKGLLKDSYPNTTTFTKLVARTLSARSEVFSQHSTEELVTRLHDYSSVLQREGLHSLDASLWACTLRFFETTVDTKEDPVLEFYRHILIDGVEAAERRCFGPGRADISPLQSTLRKSNTHQRQRPSGEWEWEEMVGCWIRKTPVPKRRRVNHGGTTLVKCLLSRNTTRSLRVIPPSKSISSTCSTASQKIFSSSPAFGSDSFDERSDLSSDGHNDKENDSSYHPPTPTRKRSFNRRSSNFSSLLADAQMNRIVLHPKHNHNPPSTISHIPTRHIVPYTPPRSSKRQLYEVPDLDYTPIILSSDDSMDLFACRTSSPIR
ncbi:hypothetical protein BJ138DRAFT_1055388 [Hygrophoropsis aurantiaca]|uniref:Uncharacterized protein n=1 Tax=Hygrophoropsis aurantiaca TaxID=72124 RepID=A0ACB8AQG6_9AGAM|nr:hypothetical protein BJ138DRAFT_1055388 [Hygrophoropsis aurantiaca]